MNVTRAMITVALAALAVPATGQELASRDAEPFLPRAAILALVDKVPPPPAPGSAADRADKAAYAAAINGIGDRNWQRAKSQRSWNMPAYKQQLSCAFGKQLDAQRMPGVVKLLGRSAQDANTAVNTAKAKFARPRPFTTDGGEACDLMGSPGRPVQPGFAYPSGHGVISALWALVLADVAPDRAAELNAFGRETGNLRVSCRVHWPSDIAAARTLASQLYRQIAATPAYRAVLAKARTELADASPAHYC